MILKTSAIVSETRKKRSVFNRILMINHGLGIALQYSACRI